MGQGRAEEGQKEQGDSEELIIGNTRVAAARGMNKQEGLFVDKCQRGSWYLKSVKGTATSR